MDLSAFIFVALAVAWAVYLVPKALKHHDDVARSRSVDRFSHTMRVLARREPVDRRSARLVVTPGRAASASIVTTKASSSTPSPAQVRAQLLAHREAARGAAKRRRRVLGLLLVVNLATLALAASSVIGWVWVAIPAVLLVAWLVACRLMVRQEQSLAAPLASPVAPVSTSVADPVEPAAAPVDEQDDEQVDEQDEADFADTGHMAAVVVDQVDPTLWDPVPVTLPTYVTKPAATRRTVRTIALDDSGVWTSGNTEGDSRLAREAEAADQTSRTTRRQGDDQRAVGS